MAEWVIVSMGGHDTIEYKNLKTSERLVCPGIKQIWYEGRYNIRWWLAYLYRVFVIDRDNREVLKKKKESEIIYDNTI